MLNFSVFPCLIANEFNFYLNLKIDFMFFFSFVFSGKTKKIPIPIEPTQNWSLLQAGVQFSAGTSFRLELGTNCTAVDTVTA